MSGAAHAVDQGRAIWWHSVAPPGDVLIGPDEDQIGSVKLADCRIRDIENLQRNAPGARRNRERGWVRDRIAQAKQGKAGDLVDGI